MKEYTLNEIKSAKQGKLQPNPIAQQSSTLADDCVSVFLAFSSSRTRSFSLAMASACATSSARDCDEAPVGVRGVRGVGGTSTLPPANAAAAAADRADMGGGFMPATAADVLASCIWRRHASSSALRCRSSAAACRLRASSSCVRRRSCDTTVRNCSICA